MTLIVLGLLNSSVPAYGEKPVRNVIVIFCDDLGYVNLRTLNQRANTWDGGRDTKGNTTGSCITLLADDYKIMRLAQDAKKKTDFSYQLQHLPDMMGKPKPSALLVEDYYKDNISDPEKKEAMIKPLESLSGRRPMPW